MSLDDSEKTLILPRIKNYDKLSKKDLVYTLLRSESDPIESNYEKYITNNTDNEIKGKINNFRITLSRLGNIITKNDRKKIRDGLYDTEKKKDIQKLKQKGIIIVLLNQQILQIKNEEYKHSNYDDLDNFGIRDIQKLFINIDDSDYYQPILVKSSFNNNYAYYKIRGDKHKSLPINNCLYMIIPELAELINKKKSNNELKIQLSMGVNFMHTTDRDKNRTFHVKSDNVEIRLDNDISNITNELIKVFLSNYQKEQQILSNGSNYTFESVDMLGIHFHDIKLKRGKSYIESPKWLADKKATINRKKIKDNKRFQYAITVALYHREIGRNLQRISKIKPHTDKYNWKDINVPAGIKDWERFERNNKDIALNILSAPSKEKINIIYKSKCNRKRKNQVILLLITNNEQEDTE